jgi:hypothetical protein
MAALPKEHLRSGNHQDEAEMTPDKIRRIIRIAVEHALEMHVENFHKKEPEKKAPTQVAFMNGKYFFGSPKNALDPDDPGWDIKISPYPNEGRKEEKGAKS